jgi:hypothetical protein
MASYIKTVKECFQKMDIEQLRLILKDEYSYQDTSKDVFLDELEGYLECHRSYGETELLMYKGVCGKETCPNKGKGGYRFVGDITGNYMDFIFVEEGDDIKDIYTCEELSCNADCGALDSRATFYIQLDKRNSFERTLDYELKLQAAMSALDELFNDKVCDMDLDKVKYWLEKHKETHLKIGEDDPFSPIMKWTAFSALYKEFSNLLEFIDGYGEQIQSAYDIRPDDNEERLIAWIIEHEELYEKIPRDLPLSVYFKNTYDGKSKNLELNFTDIEVIKLFAFRDFFTSNHEVLMNKYDSYTYDETNQEYEKNHDYSFHRTLNTLSFHLNRRKELAEKGINIPLYLKRDSAQ